ncbi:MAG: hypothetical protein AB7K52_07450 [Phycisphaerales bacterium]
MRLRIGELLVKRGVLTPDQRDRVLLEQRVRHRPFGVLAEHLFGLDARVLNSAWAEQFEADTKKIDPRREPIDHDALRQLTRRQAWQFKLFPMRFESEELLLCTTREHLPRALNFAYRHIGPACAFVLAEPASLAEALQSHYPWNGPVDMLTGDPTFEGGAREVAA